MNGAEYSRANHSIRRNREVPAGTGGTGARVSGTGPPVPSRRLGGLTARLGEASRGARAGQGRPPWLSALLVVASVLVSLLAIEGALRLFQPFELRLMGDEIRLPYFKRYELS